MRTLEQHPAIDELRAVAEEVEATVNTFSLADAIREGAGVTDQAYNWFDGDAACALSAAALSLTARGL